MIQARVNTSQVRYVLSDRVIFEDFTPNKSYAKSVIIRVDDRLYLSKDVVEGKEEFDRNDWIDICDLDEIENLIQDAVSVETTRATTAEESLDNTKLNKTLSFNKIYATNSQGQQIYLTYSSDAIPDNIVRRDDEGHIKVLVTPLDTDDAVSKEYVDNITSGIADEKQDKPISVTENNIAVFASTRDTIDSGKKFTTTILDTGESSHNNIPTEKAVRTELNKKSQVIFVDWS